MTQEQSAQAILKRHWMRLEAALMHRGIKGYEDQKRAKNGDSRG